MSNMSIRGSEYPIKKIFSDDFFFTIPLYQRAYSWTTDEAEDLLQDLMTAMGNGEEQIDDLSPYFLGSIVLIKGDEPDAQVLDGQQRLTTLTMLMAVLRYLIKSDAEYVDSLTSFLCEKKNIIIGTPKRYRLRLRERDAQFFRQYIQDEHGIEELKALQGEILPESQRNIRDNTLVYVRELQKLSEEHLIKLTQFIVNRCFLIVVAVSTSDLDSAYRIFSVLNSRGLNLSYPDILKAEIISAIPLAKQQEEYVQKWENIESLLDSDHFENLFLYLRAIFSRARLSRGMVEEFRQYVYPGPQAITPQEFIDKSLFPYAHALNNILKANYERGSHAKAINVMFRLLNQLDYGQWIPPALYYFVQNHRQRPDLVLRFLTDLERLVISLLLCRIAPYKRTNRYCDLLQAIYEGKDLYAFSSPLQLTSRECHDTLNALNGDIYLMHFVRRYILLRLDDKLSDHAATYNYETITVEHVLPQRPSSDSKWLEWFPSKEMQQKYVHRLGNLALLSQGKNVNAENFDFDRKKDSYFSTKDGISSFVITTQVLRQTEWTPAVIEQRQNQLLAVLRQLWRL